MTAHRAHRDSLVHRDPADHPPAAAAERERFLGIVIKETER